MEQSNSYVYFAFSGNDFDPTHVTQELGIEPTDFWRKGDPGKYIQQQKYSCWRLVSTGNEVLDIDKLVVEVISQLTHKISEIVILKDKLHLETFLEVVMYIDTNDEQSTPMLGHDLSVIEFLYKTGTRTDLDIYRYTSTDK